MVEEVGRIIFIVMVDESRIVNQLVQVKDLKPLLVANYSIHIVLSIFLDLSDVRLVVISPVSEKRVDRVEILVTKGKVVPDCKPTVIDVIVGGSV